MDKEQMKTDTSLFSGLGLALIGTTCCALPIALVTLDPDHDLALISTGRSPNPVKLDLTSPLHVGSEGFHVGYPQGRPGEVAGLGEWIGALLPWL